MLGKLSIIGAVAVISHDPHCTVRCKQHSPHGENLTNNLFASVCVSLRPIISFATFHLRGTSPHCQPPAWPCPRSNGGQGWICATTRQKRRVTTSCTRNSMWQVSLSTVPPAAARNFSAETHIAIRLINVPHTCERSGCNMGPDRQHYSPFGC